MPKSKVILIFPCGHGNLPPIAYLVCVRLLLEAEQGIYPQFTIHNAHTVPAIAEMAAEGAECEFQRQNGMGDPHLL